MLAGRFAGRKAVVVKTSDDGSAGKKFGHAVGQYLFILVNNYMNIIEY
jgi:hypothetical protein